MRERQRRQEEEKAKKAEEDRIKAKRAEEAKKEKDQNDFNASLSSAQDKVNVSEEALEVVLQLSQPLLSDLSDDMGETMQQVLHEVEEAVKTAQEKVLDAQTEVGQKTEAAKKYCAEVKKNASNQYSGLQKKLTEFQNKLSPLKNIKAEMEKRLKTRAALAAITEKLDSSEVELEKVSMMTAQTSRQMTDDEVAAALETLVPARRSIADAEKKLADLGKVVDPQNATKKNELTKSKDRAATTADKLYQLLNKQKEGIQAAEKVAEATRQVVDAEACLSACQEAEMPFLKGIEILPPDESTTAISECEEASKKADSKILETRSLIKQALNAFKKLSHEVSQPAAQELSTQTKKLDVIDRKVMEFKKETVARKVAAMLAEVTDSVVSTESKVETLGKACEAIPSESLDSIELDALKELIETAISAEKTASAELTKSRKIVSSRQKGSGHSEDAAMKKLLERVNTCQATIIGHRKLANSGEKLIQGKAVLVAQQEVLLKVQDSIEVAEQATNPENAEQPPDEEIETMGKTMTEAKQTLKTVLSALEAKLNGAPAPLSKSLKAAIERCGSLQERASKLLDITRARREAVAVEGMSKAGADKLEELKASVKALDEAELPFIKGVELALEESRPQVEICEKALADSEALLKSFRSFLAEKKQEVKKFAKAASDKATEAFEKLNTELGESSTKISQFKKDTTERRATVDLEICSELIAEVATAAKKAEEALAPFSDENLGTEEENRVLYALLKASEKAEAAAKSALAARRHDAKGNASRTEAVDKLAEKLKEASAEVSKHCKVGRIHEKKYVAQALRAEVTAEIEALEAKLEKTKEVCAPLVEEKGLKYLVANTVETLLQAWKEEKQGKGLSVERLFDEMTEKRGSFTKEAFDAYLLKLPETLSKDELEFAPERRSQIFDHMDSDNTGEITLANFQALFVETFVCCKPVTITDKLAVKDSKMVMKLELGDAVEALGDIEVDESTSMKRMECKSCSSGSTGFVTVEGNQGTKYLEKTSAFEKAREEIDRSVAATGKACSQLSSHLTSKSKELNNVLKNNKDSNTGPLAEVSKELNTKMKSRVSSAQSTLDSLRRQVEEQKKAFKAKEESEKKAYIALRDEKAAKKILVPVQAKGKAAEDLVKTVKEAASPLLSITGEAEQLAFATPLDVEEAVSVKVKEAVAFIDQFKALIATQKASLSELSSLPGAASLAKKELHAMVRKGDSLMKSLNQCENQLRTAISKIVDHTQDVTAAALRQTMSKDQIDAVALFAKFSGGADKAEESAFCDFAIQQTGEKASRQQLQLLCRQLDGKTISKAAFRRFLQQYYEVIKTIAITNDFNISKGKSLRKAEVGETVEVLEGPVSEEKTGMARVRVRALVDNMEGWISLTGSQGTSFLKEIPKPFYYCKHETTLSSSSGVGAKVRQIEQDEVLEVLEGPKKETFPPTIKAKVKATKDGATGWLVIKDRTGETMAEADTRLFICVQPIAITDNVNIKECKVIRKLAIGELFKLDEGDDAKSSEGGVDRIRGKACTDDAAGWITLKGNAGTLYVEATKKHYTALAEAPLTKSHGSSEKVRSLEAGEALEVLEGPKEEKAKPELRCHGRALLDGAEGWFTVGSSMATWTMEYVCKASTPLQDGLTEGKDLRSIEVGEKLVWLEGPTRDEAAGVLTIKAKAKKDGLVGYATLRSKEGTAYLLSATR